ncbi:MAG: FtsX-like permease family protein [Bacteroides sp.]|nr:FtsX-like permease family protein [Bacteroides sp.]
MIKTICHQLWNQRRMNGWIFLEILIVSIFLWLVLDPVCVLTATRNQPVGYESEGRYVVRLKALEKNHVEYKEAYEADSLRLFYYDQIFRLLREMPEVDSYTVSLQQSFPSSGNWSGGTLYPDTLSLAAKEFKHGQWYAFVNLPGSNPMKTYGLKDAFTGEDMTMPADCRNCMIISENMAVSLWGSKTGAIGKTVYESKKKKYQVAGVFQNYKHFTNTEYYPLYIYFKEKIEADPYMGYRYPFVFKLKEGVDEAAFQARFHREVAPLLKMGNIRFSSLRSFQSYIDEHSEASGINNVFRLQYALTGFALFCIFLGMLGTFWIRSNARRQEIGVMRSMGASRHAISSQFLSEAALIVTGAFLCALPLLWLYAEWVGLSLPATASSYSGELRDTTFWPNRFGLHFAIVSLVSYLVIILTALTGTYIPVSLASRILPADALRDE